MSNTTTHEAPVKLISTQEVRQLLDSKHPIQFWNVLTDEWFKGEDIAASRPVPPGRSRPRGAVDEFAQERRDRRILRRPEVSAEPDGRGLGRREDDRRESVTKGIHRQTARRQWRAADYLRNVGRAETEEKRAWRR